MRECRRQWSLYLYSMGISSYSFFTRWESVRTPSLLDGNQFILLVHVDFVGGLDGLSGEGEQEAAGLEGLLVGGDDAGGVGVVADGQRGLAVLDEALPRPAAGGGVGVTAHDFRLHGDAAVRAAAVVGDLAVVLDGLLNYVKITRREKSSGFILRSFSNSESLRFLRISIVFSNFSEGLSITSGSFVYDITLII